jgi:hypothetical protein
MDLTGIEKDTEKSLIDLNEELLTTLNELVKLESRYVLEVIGKGLYGTHPSLAQSFIIIAGHMVDDDLRRKLKTYVDESIEADYNKEELYIKVYDKMGSKYWGKGDDDTLREWGNTEEDIRNIKVRSVECHLDFYQRGIEVYKLLDYYTNHG